MDCLDKCVRIVEYYMSLEETVYRVEFYQDEKSYGNRRWTERVPHTEFDIPTNYKGFPSLEEAKLYIKKWKEGTLAKVVY